MLSRESNGLRCYRIPMVGQVEQICVYSGGKVHYESRNGWLEHVEGTFSNDVLKLDVADPVRAIKVNLDREDNFYVKHGEDRFGKRYAVYIHGTPEDLGERETRRDEESIHYARFLQLPFGGVYKSHDGEHKASNIVVRTGFRSETTDYGRKVAELEQSLRNLDVDIGGFALKRLLEFYDLTPKPLDVCRQKIAEKQWDRQKWEVYPADPQGWEVDGDVWTRRYTAEHFDTGEKLGERVFTVEFLSDSYEVA